MPAEILQPVAVLTAWSMVIWVWLYVTRIPAMQRADLVGADKVGGTGSDLAPLLPPNVQWKADNYNHLMEQPTVFYAVALLLAVAGAGDGLNATLAWLYVILRIVHSLVQVTVNRVIVRFALHAIGTLPLIALTIRALLTVFAGGVR